MQSSPAQRQLQVSDKVTGDNRPMSPESSGELSPFDLLGDIAELGPSSPTDDGLDGSQHDVQSGQKWDSHMEIAEQAKHEAEIENRIAELRKEGCWTPRRLSRFPEPARPKVHWDYLCEEMQWLAADFGQERRWKRGVARKVVRMVVRHHDELKQKEERARREEQAKLRRIATSIAKEVRQFWSNVEKVVQFKQQSRLEEKRKKALDLQLDFIVGQTEKYSDLLSQSLNEAIPVSKAGSSCVGSSQGDSLQTSPTPSICQKDGDFLPHKDEEEDDEETIEMEERQEGNDAETHRVELELLKRESELSLDELLQSLPLEILQDEVDVQDLLSNHQQEDLDEGEEEDDEFAANEDDAEDEEETIAAEEELEGQQDHTEELSQLAREGEMSLEELLQKYSMVEAEDELCDQSEESPLSEPEWSEPSDCESSDYDSEGVELLLRNEEESDNLQPELSEPKKEITDIAATAESLQPKGYTLATTQVKTAVPFLLRGDLREYQHIGLEWLVTMYEKRLNGILADEMGLGKTIQTISLLAHLACERGNWGPHLIIVPTSVILNWEMELKRWCPSFKILTYYGSQKERKLKRQGWTKANAFHVCITSYKLVLQDHQAFRRKNWKYLILDEAQNIKNFKSQRWQSLLNFNSQRRLLLTGTPLQNSLMELWSLMHFLMPHVFQSHREFKEWFSNPLTGMIEGSQEYNEGLVRRLHKVLRPFLLRRIKLDVEKQMPKKYEHVIYCRLSKRQRFLYDDFMSQAATRETLASGHFMSVINILMQLRKVCNHPNLFDPRPIHSPFITSAICYSVPSLVLCALQRHPLERGDMSMFDLINMEGHISRYESDVFLPQHKPSRVLIQEIADSPEPPPRPRPLKMKVNRMQQPVVKPDPRSVVVVNSARSVQRPPDMLSTSSPSLPAAPTSSLLSSPSVAAAGITGQTQPLPVPSVSPTVQSSPSPVSVSQATSTGKAIPVQNNQPVSSGPQRFILTPDMQARLPSGEVISLSQLASLSGRPLQSPAVTKPLTLQLQGAKLTLSGAQVRPLGVGQPRPMQGNVLHLVSSGGQHHLLSQPAQLALIQALAQQGPAPATPSQLAQAGATTQIGVQALSVQSLQHSLLNNTTLATPGASGMASPGPVSSPGLVKIVVRQASRDVSAAPLRPPLAPPGRPVLRVLPGAHAEQPNSREGVGERAAPVVATSTLTLATSPLLMVSSPALAARHPTSHGTEDTPAPPMSGVALRIVTAASSPAMQLTNQHTHTPAFPNCAPCTPNTPVVSSEATSGPLVLKAHPSDTILTSSQSVQSINGLQQQRSEPSDNALYVNLAPNPPSPPTASANIPKLPAPTYNLSLVPALLANSSPSTVSSYNSIPARILTSPVSLLALSNSGTSPVIYTPSSGTTFPSLGGPTLSAPIPASPMSATLPLLATPVSFAAPLPIPSTNQNSLSVSLSVPNPSLEAVSTPRPLSAPAALSLPATLLAPTASPASLLEAPVKQPLRLTPDAPAAPLLETAASDKLPSFVINAAVKVPSVASSSCFPPATSTTVSSSLPSAIAHSIVSSPPFRASLPLSSIMITSGPAALSSTLSTTSAPLPAVPSEASADMLASLVPLAPLEQPPLSSLTSLAPISCSSQSLLNALPARTVSSQPPGPEFTQTPSMPASAPAPLPALPASTPIPLPLLPASTPAPSTDPASLLLLSAPSPASQSVEAVTLLPSSTNHPLVISVGAPLTQSLVVSTSSHMSSFTSPPLNAQPPSVTALSVSVPVPKSTSLLSSSVPNSTATLPITSATSSSDPSLNTPLQVSVPEAPLSLSIAGPPSAGVSLSSAESDTALEGERFRMTHNLAIATSKRHRRQLPPPPRSPFFLEPLEERRRRQKMERLDRIFHLNERRCNVSPVYGTEVLRVCTLQPAGFGIQSPNHGDALSRSLFNPEQRLEQLGPLIERFIFAMPPVEAPQITLHTSHPPPSVLLQETVFKESLTRELTPHTRCLHRIIANMRTQFPDLRLIQYDCGKLQTMDRLLRQLKSGGHRVLIFTQMTRMLDVLEQFLNYHGHIYVRLDGSTRVEQRQVLMERFNMDKRIFCFILSTRSGGVGVNLTGADTVIFYDSDWNPTMDAQAQDRCHRIGQTRDVHIYRLVSERTVEENILKKAQQKRMLGDMAIEGGNFTTAYFKQQTIRELFDMEDTCRKVDDVGAASPDDSSAEDGTSSGQAHILEQALCGAEDEEDTLAASLVRAEQVADLAEFNENVPLEPEEEEQSRAEQEISALVEQLTPIERYAMYYLEASLEEISKEELKQAEEQVEAARKDLFLAKEEIVVTSEEKWDEDLRKNRKMRPSVPSRPPGERSGVRVSERLRGNKATDSTDITENLAIPDPSTTATELYQETEPSIPNIEDTNPTTESSDSPNITLESIPVQPADIETVDGIKQEETCEEAVAAVKGMSTPSRDTPVASPESNVLQEDVGSPRTPRRKVTADGEILLAGASESSPTAKVLRRLPGRLVTVVQERVPTPRRQSRGKGPQPVADNGNLSPNLPNRPSQDLRSDESSETGSPPPKRKRGRPPKSRSDMSPIGVSSVDSPPLQTSPQLVTSPCKTSELGIPSPETQTPGPPGSSLKLNSDNDSGSPPPVKRKRGRPPKKREASPIKDSPKSPVTLPAASAPSFQLDTTAVNSTSGTIHISPDQKESTDPVACRSTAHAIIPVNVSDSSNIPVAGGKGTSSSGVDEPVTPPKRKRGRPPKLHTVPKIISSPPSHNDRLDSSTERTPSPVPTRTPVQRKLKPLRAGSTDPKGHTSSAANTDDSSGEEETVIRTPVTRSARTRLQTTPMPSASSQNFGKGPQGRSPRAALTQEKLSTKKRKPPGMTSSTSPHGSSSERYNVGRGKRHCPPAERVLRSALTANPASNTRSSKPPLLHSPSNLKGRKAKT